MAFAESEFVLSKPQFDNAPLRAHLESIYRQTKNLPEQLANAPELPPLASHVWGFFCSLHEYRTANSRLDLQLVFDWSKVSGFPLELWELQAIRKIDALWAKVQNDD